MSNDRSAAQRGQYERDKAAGAYSGNPKQITWNHSLKMHECCESKKSLYHKAACPNRGKRIEQRDDRVAPIDEKFREAVRALKSKGLSSEEVFNNLTKKGIETTLARVNKAYA